MSVRVYLPSSLAGLADLQASGRIPAGPGFAVTAGLRAALPGSDEEELEYAAGRAAADLSAAGQPPGSRRVVLAADVDAVSDADPVPPAADPSHPGQVAVPEVPRRRIAAVLVDAPGADPDDELQWYAVQEVDLLLGS